MERLERLRAEMERVGLSALLLSDPANVSYATGYSPLRETGPSPHAGGPATVLVTRWECRLLVADEESVAAGSDGPDQVVTYPSYAYTEPLDLTAGWTAGMLRLVAGAAVDGDLGYDAAFPAAGAATVTAAAPGWRLRPAPGVPAAARVVKTSDELAKLRSALHLADVMQSAMRVQACPGMTELDLWHVGRSAMEAAAGSRVPVAADILAGSRTALMGGPPTDTVLVPGDLVLSDLLPCVNGYWADSCNTFCVGEPGSAALAAGRAVREALERGIAAARPGMAAADLDQVVRGHLARGGYEIPHHVGHGIGLSGFEAPWIMPFERTLLRPGMVITLEPGVYQGNFGGIRLEWVLLITDSGAEVMSQFDLGF